MTDADYMERALFHAARGRGPDQSEPDGRRGRRVAPTASSSGRASTSAPASRTPRCVRSTRRATRARGATLYCTLEPCCHHGPHRSVRQPHRRRRHRARRGRGRGSESAGPRARASRICARTASRSRSASARERRGRAEPAVLHADARGAAVRHPEGGDQRRRPHRRGAGTADAADVGGGQPPRARASAPKSTRSASASGRCWPTIRC